MHTYVRPICVELLFIKRNNMEHHFVNLACIQSTATNEANVPRGNVEGAVADKRRTGGVPVHEGRGAVSLANAAVGETGAVGLVVKEVRASEIHHSVLHSATLLTLASVV